MKKLALFLVLTLLISSFTVFADDTAASTYTNEDIIKEVMYAYYRKGTKIHYDMNHVIARRQITASPEDITAQRRGYLDCSGYASAAYAEAFNTTIYPAAADSIRPSTGNFRNFARDHAPDSDSPRKDVVGYWKIADYVSSEEKKAELRADVLDDLQVGDAIVVRYPSSTGTETGHVLVHVGKDEDGDDIMLHCYGGTSYEDLSNPANSYDTVVGEETTPAIRIDKVRDFFDTPGARYYFYKPGKQTIDLSILRPLARSGITPTDETLKRMEIRGLTMEKTSLPHEHVAVNTGDEITYTFTLENKDTENLKNVPLTDVLPAGLTYKEGTQGVSFDGTKVTWVGDINPGETKVVTYTATVSSKFPGTKIESNQSDVNGVALGNITHTVAGLTKDHLTMVANTAKAFTGSGETFSDAVDFAKRVYLDALQTYIFDGVTTVDNALDQVIDEKNYTCKTSTDLAKILVPNLYGGKKLVRKTPVTLDNFDKDRTRLVSEAELSVGDIILADYSGGSVGYIYAGDKTLVSLSSGAAQEKTIGDNIYANPDNILISLLAYDRFAVLRPSMADLEVGGLLVTDIDVTVAEDAKLEYEVGESFDTSCLTVVATKSDGSTEPVENFTITPSKFSAPGEEVKVTVYYRGFAESITVKVTGEKPLSVKEAIDKGASTEEVTVQGYFAGVSRDGHASVYEFLLKDKETNNLIAVRSSNVTSTSGDETAAKIFGKPFSENFGYQKGDELVLTGKVIVDNVRANYNKKKLILSINPTPAGITQEDTIMSRDNDLNFDLAQIEKEVQKNNAVISDWEDDMIPSFNETNARHYGFYKFTGDMYERYVSSTYGITYVIHKNGAATADAGTKTETKNNTARKVAIRDDLTTLNLGENWREMIFKGADPDKYTTAAFPGNKFNNEFYAVYLGGGSSYLQLGILDESWILTSDDGTDEPDEPEDPVVPDEPEDEATVTGIEVTTKPTKLVYTVGEALDTTGMVVTATMSDGSAKTLTAAEYSVTPQTFTTASASTTVTVKYETFTATFTVTVNAATQPEEPETPDTPATNVLSVSKAHETGVKDDVTVRGIVVGVAWDKFAIGYDLLLKDEVTNDVIGVRNSAVLTKTSGTCTLFGKEWNTNGCFGYQKGQIVELAGKLAYAATTTGGTTYNDTKLVLALTGTTAAQQAGTIKGTAEIKWDIDAIANDPELVTISNMDDIKANFTDAKAVHYKFYKFTSGMYEVYNGSDLHYLHYNSEATEANDLATETLRSLKRKLAMFDVIAEANLGEGWQATVFGENVDYTTTTYPGAVTENEFYAMYTGGGSYYLPVVILDESWIIDEVIETKVVSADNTSVTLQIGEVGDYDIVIADFEGNSLNNVEIIEKTVTDLGEVTIPRVKTFALNKDDKVMLFKDFKTLVPIGLPFIFE